MRKIEVPIDTHTEFELVDTAVYIQTMGDREATEKVEETTKQMEESRREETTHLAEVGVAEKC